MADILNVARVLQYTYTSGGRPITHPGIEAQVSNQYTVPTVLLTKVCSVIGSPTATAADLNEPIRLTYTVTNTASAPINYTSVIIQDSILTNNSIQIIGNVTGGTYQNDTITVELPAGVLAQNQSATFTIDIMVIGPSVPSNVLATVANATFTTAQGSVNFDDDACGLGYQHAEFTIKKLNNPQHLVTQDEIITYTIQIENTGNVEGTIAQDGFVDQIPTNTAFVQIIQGTGTIALNTSGTAITNSTPITLGPLDSANNSIQFQFSVRALRQ